MAARSEPTFQRHVVACVRERAPAGARVLELSCGDGRILEQLAQTGFEVEGTNYRPDPAASKRIQITDGVDLLELPLPFEANSRDVVLLLDVLEHLPAHAPIVREIGRLLRPGGLLVLSTPNIQSVRSRLRFLLNGFFRIQRAFVPFDLPPERAFEFHNYPVHLPVLLWQLSAYGFDPIAVDGHGRKLKATWLWLALWPFIKVSSYLKAYSREKYLRRSGASALVYRIMTDSRVLRDDTLIVTATRAGSEPARRGG